MKNEEKDGEEKSSDTDVLEDEEKKEEIALEKNKEEETPEEDKKDSDDVQHEDEMPDKDVNKKEEVPEENKKEYVEEDKKENREASEDIPSAKGKDSEEVCGTFEVDDKKGEHEIVTCDSIPKKHADKKELKSHNIILRNILIVLGLVIVAFITWMIFLNFIGSVTYEGLSFEVVSQGDLIFYKHVVPLYNGDAHYANYNFFLRKNPYKTGEIPFEGELNIRNFAAINTTAFTCEGKGIIAMANMVKPFEVAGIQVVNDQNASCDEESRYMLLHIFPGDENKIVQTGESCYDMTVRECDILDVTERMMIEMFVKLKEADDNMQGKDMGEDVGAIL
jgi:hypothetical protein